MASIFRVDWRLTRTVRVAVREDRVIVTSHVWEKLPKLGLNIHDLDEILRTGIVSARTRRDEKRTAIDGYKHFLHGVTLAGKRYEIVFKLVRGRAGDLELVVLITLYRGRA